MQGSGFRVQGAGFRVWGFDRVWGSGSGPGPPWLNSRDAPHVPDEAKVVPGVKVAAREREELITCDGPGARRERVPPGYVRERVVGRFWDETARHVQRYEKRTRHVRARGCSDLVWGVGFGGWCLGVGGWGARTRV